MQLALGKDFFIINAPLAIYACCVLMKNYYSSLHMKIKYESTLHYLRMIYYNHCFLISALIKKLLCINAIKKINI